MNFPLLPNFFFTQAFGCVIFFDYGLDGWKKGPPFNFKGLYYESGKEIW